MKTVFGYCRVSTAAQIEKDGFPRQSESINNFCEARGWGVLRTFKEQHTGSDSHIDRPKLSEAIALCGPATSQTIVVERIDRIARDLIVSELFFNECKKKGIEVFSADTGEELVSADGDPSRKLIRQILGALGEWEKAQIVAKMQAGRRRVARRTGVPCGGRPALGREDSLTAVRCIQNCLDRGLSWDRIALQLCNANIPNGSGSLKWSRGSAHSFFKTAKGRHATDA